MKFTTGSLNIQQLLADYDCFLLDFDGTLYNETDYLFPAYRSIAKYLAGKYNVQEAEVAMFLENGFTEAGRSSLLNALCQKFKVPEDEIPHLLQLLRTVAISPPITLFEKMAGFVGLLSKANKQIFVVTNGNAVQQKNKVALVNWQNLNKHLQFIYTAEHQPKPSSAAFEFIKTNYSVVTAKTIMIGDTATDQEFAANSGIAFLHVSAFEPLNQPL